MASDKAIFYHIRRQVIKVYNIIEYFVKGVKGRMDF